jgi:hypothetical protein
MDIGNTVKRHKLIQSSLRNRRELFVAECLSERLYHAHIQNRYLNEEYKNQFEIQKIWDKLTKELADSLIKSENFPELRRSVIQILVGNAEKRLASLKEFGLEEESKKLSEAVSAMKDFYQELSARKYELFEEYAKKEKIREIRFMELMLEMMDTAEKKKKELQQKK